MNTEKPLKKILFGIFLICFSTLFLEVTLSRIFSVTMWYHFAFMAISLALFGMSCSGIIIYILKDRLINERTPEFLALSSLMFPVSLLISFIVYINLPFSLKFDTKTFFMFLIIYFIISIPFFISGLIVSLTFASNFKHISKLYFSDLLGASLGCISLIPILSYISAPNAIIFVALLGSIASVFFCSASDNKRLFLLSIGLTVFSISFLIYGIIENPLKIKYTKAYKEYGYIYEKWNPLARITVYSSFPFEGETNKPFGWGLSNTFKGFKPKEMWIEQDASAGTPIVEFDGDIEKIKFLSYDITALAYYLKQNPKVLIIGPGGGRDVLTAFSFGSKKITGVEINPNIIDVVKNRYKEFTGNLYNRKEVEIIKDEGRSYISRSQDNYDLIQLSLVDSWAAISAGAFILTENNLYTKEAFASYYDHLAENGVLTMSRWFFTGLPGETLRLVSLGLKTLEDAGVKDPSKHIMVVKKSHFMNFEGVPDGVATFIMKKSAFGDEEINVIEDLCSKLGFEIVYTPRTCNEESFKNLIYAKNLNSFFDSFPIDISPPTDDRPFFFHMLKIKNFYKLNLSQGMMSIHLRAVTVLGTLLIIITILSIIFIFGPLLLFKKNEIKKFKGKVRLLLYFACLGLGFMMIEISLIQQFILFLGHPLYSFSVFLFSLLLFSSLGSFSTEYFNKIAIKNKLQIILMSVVLIVLLYIFILPKIMGYFLGIDILYKIIITVGLLAPLGFFMGMPFPLGIKLLENDSPEIIPWVWGINGATSVLATILSTTVAIIYGFSLALIFGAVTYVISILLVRFYKSQPT
ncbi:MAG: hypothetical protein HZA77_08950 [Candidatus Schekmanbacteria bacterium]|nr:hypothetical protein [Candidatus Schekmanbacteria bacterium]